MKKISHKIREYLGHPLTKNIDIDSPTTTYLRRQIIQQKVSLKSIYDEWYNLVSENLPDVNGSILELGSGAGYLDKYIPNLITSEIFRCPDLTLVLDGMVLPFKNQSLRAIVMTDVLHHICNPRLFFVEATRCVKDGGVVILVEPWNTVGSKLIYTHFHHEPFMPNEEEWHIPISGPLSGANGAMPWIIFERDRHLFCSEFPKLQISKIQLMGGLRYMASGGVSMRALLPDVAFNILKRFDHSPHLMPYFAMFAFVVIRKIPS